MNGMNIKDEDGIMTHFAYDGYGRVQLTNRSNNARLRIDASYGHAIISVTPSFSISLSGDTPSIDFGIGVDEQHCTGEFYENYTITKPNIYHGTIYGKNNTGGTAT